jgi:hypothetical protein
MAPKRQKISSSTCSLLWTEEVHLPASGYHVACRATLLQDHLIVKISIWSAPGVNPGPALHEEAGPLSYGTTIMPDLEAVDLSGC